MSAGGRQSAGLLPRQHIRDLVRGGGLAAGEAFRDTQFQPASLDLRLGARAYRVRTSFLPGAARSVGTMLAELNSEPFDLREGAILERGCVYVVELLERLALPGDLAAGANPKSSTGRLDVFTRLIADGSTMFDTVPAGYAGPLYAEVSPRTFSVKVRQGTRLNQIRFRRVRQGDVEGEADATRLTDRDLRALHGESGLVDDDAIVRDGLVLRIELAGERPDEIVGYRAQRHADVIDVDRRDAYPVADYWDAIRAGSARRLILDPNEFYILASKERLHIPADYAAEMVPIDPLMGEFRVHYAGFFDPGFGFAETGHPGSRAVLEVRSHEVPFLIEDGQMVCRLAYEKMVEPPDALYGAIGTSNYQGQDLRLSKQFRDG